MRGGTGCVGSGFHRGEEEGREHGEALVTGDDLVVSIRACERYCEHVVWDGW